MLTLAAAGVAAFTAGCPPQLFGECQFLNDPACPAGEQCQDGTCVPVGDVVPPRPPIVVVGDAGPLPPGVNAAIDPADLEEPQTIAWLDLDPRATGQAVFAEYEPNGFDLLRVFSIDDGEFVPAFELDFTDDFAGCNLDSFSQQSLNAGNELWFNCNLRGGTRVTVGNDLAQYYDMVDLNGAPIGSQLVYPTPGVQDVERRLVCNRGQSGFTSIQINNGDDPLNARELDTVNVAFTNIVSFHAIEAGNIPGDHVAIYDRGQQVLRPMTLDGTDWNASTTGLLPLDLPAGTHAVLTIGTIRANGTPAVADLANVVAIVPSEGRLRFFNMEDRIELDDPGTLYEPDPALRGATPVASERLLLGLTPSGDAIMYTNQSLRRVYRIPLRADADDEVRSFDFDPTDRRPSGIVVASEDEVWVTYGVDPGGPAVERVLVDQVP
jgi:hypothetical protein